MPVEVLETAALMLVLLNPFLLMVYLADVVERLDHRRFREVLLRAGLIATAVFCAFAIAGDAVFSRVLQADIASFQIFGGIVFLVIALQFVFRGPRAIEILRGESEHLAGAIAMPVFIGPGSISVSVLAGKRHEPLFACAAILGAVVASILVMVALKRLHDAVRERHAPLIARYIEVTGRIAALVVGTISIDMIMRGTAVWVEKM